ncbi:MAG: hypothetical protein KF760_27305, partial [Candidatus Eremiobacteraeota bacterium]|nr:hypothetical protein [Candidatus Eremiobacteraeota bacterium]
MQIPSQFQPTVNAYHAQGTLSGHVERIELDDKGATDSLNHLKDEFQRWKSLDESEFDLLKGRPGAVRLERGAAVGEYSEAVFSGDTQNGQLAVVQNDPSTHYGYSSYAETKFT